MYTTSQKVHCHAPGRLGIHELPHDGKTNEICYRWNGIIFHLTLLT
jgi:hypothetical protein